MFSTVIQRQPTCEWGVQFSIRCNTQSTGAVHTTLPCIHLVRVAAHLDTHVVVPTIILALLGASLQHAY